MILTKPRLRDASTHEMSFQELCKHVSTPWGKVLKRIKLKKPDPPGFRKETFLTPLLTYGESFNLQIGSSTSSDLKIPWRPDVLG
jgi:hypothetical protein